MSSRPPRRLLALYRWTTTLMPRQYRATYADEQIRLFEQMWRDERPRHPVAQAWWAARLLVRSVLAAIGVRLDRRRRRLTPPRAEPPTRLQMGSDLRFTVRSVKASAWYAAAVCGVIAVTTALATTAFAIVDGVLFRPLPYPDSDRLVSVEPAFRDGSPRTDVEYASVSHADIANWQAAVPEVQFTGFSVGRWAETGAGTGINEDTAGIADVLPNFFDVIGTRPLFGGFSADDFLDRAGYRPVVLMYDTWQARFGGDPDVLGKIEILIRPRDFGFRIVGVMPASFTFPSSRASVDFIAPMATPAKIDPRLRNVNEVVARVSHRMSIEQLDGRLAPGLAATAALYASVGGPRPGRDPRTERPYDTVRTTRLSESLERRSGRLFLGVTLAAALLVVLAGANVSSLMTARALERQREFQLRRALGAAPHAIVRLWTTEAALLLSAGAILGALAAAPVVSLIVSLLPQSIVLLKPPRLDWRVAGFVVMTMAVMCAAVTVAPIRASLRPQSGGPVKGGASERLRTSGRFLVIAGQIAAAFVLTILGACLVGSLLVVYGQALPIRTDGVVVLESRLHPTGGPLTENERVARGRVLRERLSAIPGVSAVGLVEAEVLRGGGSDQFSRPEGVGRLAGIDSWGVTGGFYRVVEPIVVAGRLPTGQELDAGDPLLVVSERVAQAYWPGADPIGQTLTHSRSKVLHTVVGVVQDVRWHGWDLESPMIYGPYTRMNRSSFQTYFIRTGVDTASTIQQALRAVVEADPATRPRIAATLEEMYSASIALRRFHSWLFGGFAAAALAVLGVGILGLLAMSAARRTKEVGIRCALGSTPGSVAGLLLGEQFAAVAAGMVAGAAVAAWAVRLIDGYLYKLSAGDPRIWSAAVVVILVTAGIGTLVPALRATRIDPLQALRAE